MKPISNKKKIGGIGASEISKLFTKQGLKAKTAHTLCLEKAIEVITGHKKDITTVAMQHGLFNEEEAYYMVVEQTFPNAKLRSSDSIWIGEGLWATPDVVDNVEELTIDIKCPYTIASYWKNVNSLPNSYIYQNQMQMMATGHKKGYVCIYLTSNRIDDYGNKIEYDIDINERHAFIPIEFDEVYTNEIKVRFDEFRGMRDRLVETLMDVSIIDDIEFFYIHKESKVTRLRDKSNIFGWHEDNIVKNGDFYYVIEN